MINRGEVYFELNVFRRKYDCVLVIFGDFLEVGAGILSVVFFGGARVFFCFRGGRDLGRFSFLVVFLGLF